MKPSLEKLRKFFQLESERGFDNHAVLGGMERMLVHWEPEANKDGLPQDFILAVTSRMRDYAKLSQSSRAEIIQGLLKRMQKLEEASELEPRASSPPAETTLEAKKRAPSPPKPHEKIHPAVKADVTAIPLEPPGLEAEVTVMPGVGKRNAQNLERLGIRQVRDFLFHYPRRYVDYAQLKPINRLKYGEEVTIIGSVEDIRVREMRGGQLKATEAIIRDTSGAIRVTWFNNPWLVKRLPKGTHIALSGKVEQYLGRLVMNNPEWEPLDTKQLNTNRIVPVYPLTTNMTQRWLRRLIHQAISFWTPRIPDPLPPDLRQRAGLIEYARALEQIHFPDSWDDLAKARERLAFDEIFFLQLGIQRQRQYWKEQSARRFHVSEDWVAKQIERLPFRLTNAQMRAIEDMRSDLESGHPMNRLLQGDVGSGKTVVAALTALMVISGGAQAALMAPTSILAEQHYQNLLKLLAPSTETVLFKDLPREPFSAFPLDASEIRLLLGATPEGEKKQIRSEIESGAIKLLIGTHALLEDPIQFKDLQLVIIDEQHRFGVEQRAALRAKGTNPHLLVMTATPIPRSLALTIYGDLDLTILGEMPPGRKPVETHVLHPQERERAYTLIRSQIEKGHQAFIIYPLIEESEEIQAKAAVEERARLQQQVFPQFKVGLVHGRMRAEEKEAVMRLFHQGKYHILVSTTVIEVGVDVPNATVMLIEGANRFGLAQLHQLRGRVGRSAEHSYCLLIPETSNDLENERLQTMVQTNDGFVLAEKDLQQRGPGEFLGTRQSGYAEFAMANLTNIHLIEKARRFAQEIFQNDPRLIQDEHRLMREKLERTWKGRLSDIS